MNLRGGRWGEAIVAVAGPISNLILAIAAAIPLRYMLHAGMVVPILPGVLYLFITINLLLMVFNLIPIPPLDGSKVLYAFLDPRTAWQVRSFLEQYGIFILLGAMFLPIFGGNTLIGVVFNEVFDPLVNLLVGI
jgi:Zn-dependent protease